ncbi:MAG: Co2+/Mg2+ efflux protein ApaG [Bacteroidetes bacterium]|nr:Co2+/Mg2+ efflux protein ApaG [Bacteroidota bacterium]MBS1683142.1 Co2+/Mg2+ efflux protein ApaG [Bacteroidota bacterium]
MVSEITAGIEVSVQTMYQDGHSRPDENRFVFAYKISISNHNDHTVQLLSRRWIISNGIGGVEIVEGEGVVGRQPVLYKGDMHEYVSGCNLITPFGTMEGSYFFQNKATQEIFEVHIPLFKLEATFALN